MKRIPTTLSLSLCLLLSLGFGVSSCRSQDAPPNGLKTLENSGGGKIIYGALASQSSQTEGMVSMLRTVHAHFGDRPQVGELLKSRDGNTLAAFFTVNAKNDADKPVAGLVIVAARANATPQAAVLYDNADRFASAETEMLHLLAAAVQTPEKVNPTLNQDAPATAGPFHLASGGDKSASVCLPADWTVIQVSGGSLTAKGPHSEIVALGFAQMVLDPKSAEGRQLAHAASFSNLPKAKFPDEGNLFTTFTGVLNQLRATRKLPPASFTLTSSTKLDSGSDKVRPVEAVFDLDLADGAGPRTGTARIDVFRSGKSPEWLLSASSSSIPIAYAAAEKDTLRAVVRSFRQNEEVIRGMISGHGPGGDPIHRDHDHEGYMYGEDPKPWDCAAISGPAPGPVGWPGKIAESFILDPAAGDNSVEGTQADAAGKLTEWLVRSHPDLFEVVKTDAHINGQDY